MNTFTLRLLVEFRMRCIEKGNRPTIFKAQKNVIDSFKSLVSPENQDNPSFLDITFIEDASIPANTIRAFNNNEELMDELSDFAI